MNFSAAFEEYFSSLVRGSEFESRCYWVGGAVRDRLLGRLSLDFDLAIEQDGGAQKLAEYLCAKAPDCFSQPHFLGQGYPIWQIVLVTFPASLESWKSFGPLEIQIADTQIEMFPDPQTRQRITKFGTLHQDCARRDFTCNMLYQNCVTGELLDPSACGIEDIRQGVLRGHPEVKSEKMFFEDPLRIIRLFRFQALFGWKVDARLVEGIKNAKARLSILSPERVHKEWVKIIEGGGHTRFFRSMDQHEVLELLFPELSSMKGCLQDSKFHSEGDVWVHTLLVMEKTPNDIELQLAALLHDFGKVQTQSFKEGRIQFIGHEKVSAEFAKTFLKKWCFGASTIDHVTKLILLHLRGYDAPSLGQC